MSKPGLPTLTHLQFLVLGMLADRECAGRALRAELAEFGVRSSGPAFYQMMSRLEAAGWVEGWYEQIAVGDQAVTERRYRSTAEGVRLWTRSRAFYERVAAATVGKRWSRA
jgi:DNA-binding PadR family transcriptional regulator